MRTNNFRKRFCWCVVLLSGSLSAVVYGLPAEEIQNGTDKDDVVEKVDVSSSEYHTITLSGRVVWVSDLLKRRFGVATVPEAKERILALETKNGDFYPITEDVRGRSFRVDDRLRKMDVELLVRRHQKSPMIQIIRIREIDGKEKFDVDYWCDECSIIMFETGPCACCQDHNRLRKRLVKE